MIQKVVCNWKETGHKFNAILLSGQWKMKRNNPFKNGMYGHCLPYNAKIIYYFIFLLSDIFKHGMYKYENTNMLCCASQTQLS